MTFMQQWGGVLVVALFLAITIGGAFLRRWLRRFQNNLIDGNQQRMAYGASGPMLDTKLQEVAKVVVFSAPAYQVATALAPQFTKPWIASGPLRWGIPVSKKNPALSEIAVVEDTAGGSRLALVQTVDELGMPSSFQWTILRITMVKAAKTAGIEAREEVSGARFVRTPDRDTTGLSRDELVRMRFTWRRSEERS